MSEHEYRGIPLEEIRIESVEWTPEVAAHISTRSQRVRPTEVDLSPEEAIEAAMDPHRLVRPARSESLEVLGYSTTRRRVLKVWLYPKNLEAGEWYGASAAVAGRRLARRYLRSAERDG